MPNSKMYKKIAKYAGCNHLVVKNVLHAYGLFIADEILEKRKVWLPKVGHFELKYHGAIRVRNVAKGGGETTLPGYYKIVLKVCRNFKNLLQNSPFLQIK